MSAIDLKTLKRLLPSLEAVKERDAAAFRARRDAAEALRAQIRTIEQGIAAAAQAVEEADLAGHSAYLRFRAAGLAKIAALAVRLPAAEAEERAARETLSRSHGSLEGCATLARKAEEEARRR